jgi:hypothetical protein
MKRLLVSALFSSFALLSSASADWEPVLTDLLKSEEPGYGGLCGLVVDHATGEVFVNLSDLGIYRSSDQGKTWKQVTKTPPKGRTESPGCWSLNPTGKDKTMVTALVYGAPISISTDQGATFRSLDARSEHIDWCAVDWTDLAMGFILALKHEQGGLLIASNDGGKTFRDIGKSYIAGWVFDKQTAVVAKETGDGAELQRTTDGGQAFSPCGPFTPVGSGSARALPKWKDGNLYWLTREGLISSADRGATWTTISVVEDALYGPVFGATPAHLLVLTRKGILESTNGGTTWSELLPGPADFGDLAGLTWLDYDPTHDTFYLMKMTSDLYRLVRSK